LNNGQGCNITSYEILKNNNYQILLVENYPCNNIDELRKQERFYIENNDCVNKNIPGRTKQEYRITNVEKEKEQHKIWHDKNIEKIKIIKKNTEKKIKKKLKNIKKNMTNNIMKKTRIK